MTGLEALIDRLLLTTQAYRNRQASLEREAKLQQELDGLKDATQNLCRALECRQPPEEPKASRYAAR